MSELIDRIGLLKHTPIFQGVSTDDLRVVASQLEEEVYFTGDRVFELNDRSDKVFFIRSGKVGIALGPQPGAQDPAITLGAGECFGEMAMFDDKPRSATAQVIEDCRLLSLEKIKLRALLVSYPELALGMLRTLSERLRDANLKR